MKNDWKTQPASQKQIDALASVGIKCPPTKGEASELISEQFRLAKERSQKRFARRNGTCSMFGTGEVGYSYGVMDYCDDGNGNTWHIEDDWNGDCL